MMFLILALLAVANAETCNRICHMNYAPVCGSDGKTYGNECELTSTACVSKSALRVAHTGECVAKQCNRLCHPTWEPVCGSDDHTYGNLCELESLSCLAKTAVKVSYQGECVKCNKLCHPTWVPVCGTDGVTYGNLCELESLSCLARQSISVAQEGECPVKHTDCQKMCTMEWSPVCGTDGQTYGNECALTSSACLEKKNIRMVHRGEC